MSTLAKFLVLLVAILAVEGRLLPRLAPLAQVATANEFAHQVSIQLDGMHHCGGALISKRHVLTAGHCVRGIILDPTPTSIKGRRMVVEVGSTVIGAGTKHAIKRISQHREFQGENAWSPEFMPNDIAVITLRTPVTLSASVQTINLPEPFSELTVGDSVTISGFGSANANEPSSPILKKSPMRIVAKQECNDYFIKVTGKRILPSHICANYAHGYGTCQGDSGGPLIRGKTIIGVVSGGDGVCSNGAPDVYTKVSHFIQYIKSEMNYNSEVPEFGPTTAINIDDSTKPMPPSWMEPSRPPQSPFNPFPDGHIQFIDPVTGSFLPSESVILVDPETGVPLFPVAPESPRIPLYPIYPNYPNFGEQIIY